MAFTFIRAIFVAMALSAVAVPACMADDRPLVLFANPGGKGDVFFQPMTDFMQAAADDLGFELAVYYTDRDSSHLVYGEGVEIVFNHERKPDYIIGMNPRGAGVALIKQAEKAGVGTVTINQSFLGNTREQMGRPGEKYKHWLFEYLPDDTHSGYLLATVLIEQALAEGLVDGDLQVRIVGINGHKRSAASVLRAKGLEQAVADHPRAMLQQIVHADWKFDKARELTSRLLVRYPETSVIWAASDLMGAGAVAALQNQEGKLNTGILVGGIDWTQLGLEKVRNEEFATTVGGHFMDGGWALVMLYDYIHGVEIPRNNTSQFSRLTAKNVDEYLHHFGDGDWSKIDFKRFSKHLNPDRKSYDFGLSAILEQARGE